MSIPKKSLTEVALLLAFKAILELVYVQFVNPLYEYMGFFLDLNLLKLFESYVFLVMIFFSLPHEEKRISAIGLKILFLIMIVPTLSLYALIDGPRIFVYFLVGGFFITIFVVRTVPLVRINTIETPKWILFSILGVVSILVCLVLLKISGIPTLSALTFSHVYEIRREFDYGPRIMGFLIPWVANVINCLFIGLAWYKRRYLILFLVLGLQVFLFLMTPHKGFLFSPLLVLFLVYATRRQRVMALSLFCLISVVLFSYVLHKSNISNYPASLFVRRVFFLPSRVSFCYYDFFSSNEHMHLSESKMGFGLFDNPHEHYQMSIPNIMGMIYANNPDCNMNTGYIGDAFMNFGLVGILVFSLILGLVLVAADSLSRGVGMYATTAAVGVPLFKLINAALFTSMLTGGFLLGIFVIWLYRE